MQRNIALMVGGNSSEYEISLKSGAQIESIIDRSKYNPYLIIVRGKRMYYKYDAQTEIEVDKNDFSITIEDKCIFLEYALILIHGTPGENGILQGFLEFLQIPYSSCNLLISALTFDKSLTKRALADYHEITTAKDVLLDSGDKINSSEIVKKLGLPIFVKPNASGSSFGVTKVKREEDIADAIANAFKESDQVIIEEFIEGREIGCGVMVAGGKSYVLPVTEILSKRDFFDFEAKYEGLSEEITPAQISEDLKLKLNRQTSLIYKALRCSGVVRIDFIVKGDTPYFIEINTVPGMSGASIVPQQVCASGMTLTDFFNILIEDTFL